VFDALLHGRALGARALADLRFFGVEGALVPAEEPPAPATAASLRRSWEAAITAVRRLRRAGLAAWAAVGIPPGAIPARGLEALLAELPAALGRPEVAALGPVGLADGGEQEERVLARQLELARELRRPVLARAPWRGRERRTRRLLAALAEAEVEPRRVLVAGADARTVKTILACGHLAGLPLSPGEGGGGIDAAVRLVAALGSDGIALCSEAGLGGGDLLALPRAADRMARAGLGPAVIRRACGGNALRLLGVDPAGLALRASSGRSARRASR
jgi:predicted metal-dependent TIM-barrel fold hydrolase